MDEFQRLKESVKPNFIFYRALVENNNDPEKLSRCKVRIAGIHTNDKEKLPTEALPWAELMLITARGYQGIPLQGDWVWVFFDKEEEDRPIIMGHIPVINAGKPDTKKGFTDPSGKYPIEKDYTSSTTHRFSKVEELDKTPHKIINDTLSESNVSGASNGVSISVAFKQLASTNDSSKYPDVQVQETAAGHIHEIDDTAGNHRIRVLHSSLTYNEINNTGTITLKSVENFERYIIKDDKEFIKGNKLKHVKGNETNAIEGNRGTLVKGNDSLAIVGNQTEGITGNFTQKVTGNVTRTVAGKEDVNISGGLNVNAGPKATIHAGNVFINSTVFLG
jgi:hypothetical protein